MSRKRQILSILAGFIVLYTAILMVNLILGVGPNLLMKSLSAAPAVRAYAGSTVSCGLRLAAYILLSALAIRKVLGTNPWPVFFPFRKNIWKDILFGLVLVSGILGVFFVIEVRAGWLVVDGWNWQKLTADVWLRTAWVGFLVNLGVAVGEETIFRGYLLSGLNAALGRWRALLSMMFIFGVFHLFAYAESGLQSATLALAILLASPLRRLFRPGVPAHCFLVAAGRTAFHLEFRGK
jgi:membrane protease YdiL (CAAX protease family)